MNDWMKGCLAGVLALGVWAGPVAACQIPGDVQVMQQQIIGWMNAERQARGMRPLRASGALQRSATSHACAMAESRAMVHRVPGGPSFRERLQRAGYRPRAANENIGYTSALSVWQITSMWSNSPSHLKNVLDPKVREVGVGIAISGEQIFWATNTGAS